MSGSTTAPGHVLVVDDTPQVRSLVALILRSEGYDVSTAANGVEALERIEEQAPDLVLLDLAMPVMNGWELQQRLREQGWAIPVVFMTASAQARREAERHNADGYVAKPFDPDVLLQTVARFSAPSPAPANA